MSSQACTLTVTHADEVIDMSSDNYVLKRFSHSVGQNWYHVILVPRARYPVFQFEDQRLLMIEAIEWFCKNHSVDLFTKEVMSDHVHLFISCPPDHSIRKLVQKIKGATSYFIRKKKPALKRYDSLWSRGFMYRSVGAITGETVRKYIDESNKWSSGVQTTLKAGR